MGRTVAELEATMGLHEFDEWCAYHDVEPFGPPADDDRWRQHYALFFSANTAPGTQQPAWLDRDPEETARLRAMAQAALSNEDAIEAWFARIGVIETHGLIETGFTMVANGLAEVGKNGPSS